MNSWLLPVSLKLVLLVLSASILDQDSSQTASTYLVYPLLPTPQGTYVITGADCVFGLVTFRCSCV